MTPAPARNRLDAERSPYLAAHASDPVAWWPWCDEAFEAARDADVPVFLSVGYSACHWCHVMQRESFADPEVAERLARDFIAVKVDREERPEVDAAFQRAFQLLTGRSGGWPLSMFLTPERAAFVGATYLPSTPRAGRPSFGEVLQRVAEVWRARRGEVLAQATALTEALAAPTRRDDEADEPPSTAWLDASVEAALARADRANGGFGRAPKFPNATAHEALLLHAAVTGSGGRAFVGLSLRALANGGVRDQLGGGYARYSTDARWLVPHFEKMLDDNATLLRLWTSAWRHTQLDGERGFVSAARSSREVLDIAGWMAREMTSPEGMLFSSQDADSGGGEGRYFVWSARELDDALGERDGALARRWYAVAPRGNFEGERSVLSTPEDPFELAREQGMSVEALLDRVEGIRARLLERRALRPAPATDDKCIAAWNGLALASLADAGATLEAPELVDAAARGLDAWRRIAWREGRVARAVRDGVAWGAGYLEDHAALALAALALWSARFDPSSLAFARALADAIVDRFVDHERGAFYEVARDGDAALPRVEDADDHAHPSGTAMAIDALLRLATLTGQVRYQELAEKGLRRYGPLARGALLGRAALALAADRAARGPVEVIVVGDAPDALLAAARSLPLPHGVIVWARDARSGIEAGIAPELLAYRGAGPGGEATAYVCRGDACEMPTRDPDALRATLRRGLRAEEDRQT